MTKIRVGATGLSVLLTFVLVASAQATITTTSVATPADGSLLFENLDTNPGATVTVSGTTDGITGDTIDIGCYSGDVDNHDYTGGPTGYDGPGIAVNPDGSFSTAVPYSFFAKRACNLVAVPHGTATNALPSGDTGSRVSFSYFQTSQASGGGPTYDYAFDDLTLTSSEGSGSIDDCGPYAYLVDGTSAMNFEPELFGCVGSLYNSRRDFYGLLNDLSSSEIEVDGQNAYGSDSAYNLFSDATSLAGFPALSASLDSFDTSTRDAQTAESEPLVKCTPEDAYNPAPSSCTAFASTGVAIKRVTDYTNNARVVTTTDTFSSTDGLAHSLELRYEADVPTGAGWQFPGQTSLVAAGEGETEPVPSSAPGTIYVIDTPGTAPSLSNPVGAMTFSTPYNGVTFDNTLWEGAYMSGLVDYQEMVPAGGSTSITWSYATGTSLAEVQSYAAAARTATDADAAQAPAITISSPASGATETSSVVTVTGAASAGSGVKSVTVNGVTATVSGGTWSAAVPLVVGQNTLTATVTSVEGNKARASATVTYAPPTTANAPSPHLTVKGKRFNGKAVLLKLACAAGGSTCAGKITLRYTETVVKRHKKKKRVTVIIASRRYSLNAGQMATISVALNGSGRRLLKMHGKLSAKGTVTVTQPNSTSSTAAGFGLTLRQPKKHRR
jgi:hypothetical protein